MSMHVQMNPQSRVAADQTPSQATFSHSKGGLGSVGSSLTVYADPTPSTDDKPGFFATVLSYPKKAWDFVWGGIKGLFSYCCSCFKPSAPAQSSVAAFTALVKTKDVKAEDVKAAFDKLPKEEKEKIIEAVRAQGKAEGDRHDEDEAIALIHGNGKIVAKALDRMAVNAELVAFGKVFKDEGSKPEAIRAAFNAMGTVAQQEVTHAVATAKGSPLGFNALDYLINNAKEDEAREGVKVALKKYQI